MTTPEPTITATRYEVSCLPPEHAAHRRSTVAIERRGPDSWAVMIDGFAHDAHGEPSIEPRPSERTDEWLARYRFDLETATAVASKLARIAAAMLTGGAR
ncbi:hypothetical protein ATM97_27880 [Nocardia sp. MH4]|uniref:hypothetical protein n=1 Tax=Nocardia sp. MH4 TaxID=1768677 RepID=UPI001C500F84|nr:hypothetical protein [Nocardia sp. MH4]MBW0275025.1 hypothetical protein [Nocardia sp. MH4]